MSRSVRIAHFSDTHLGYRATNKIHEVTSRNLRTVDVEDAFTRVIDSIIEQKVDGVIHSGDVFHHSRPTWQSLRHFIRQMRKLEQAGIPTLVIAGNHDTPRVRTGGSAYSVLELALPDIRFVAEYEEADDVTTFAHLDIRVQAIPHGALTNPDPVFPQIKAGTRNILVTHGLVPGVLKAPVMSEPGEQSLDHNLLDPRFDYHALGHIHQTQQVSTRGWYAGSTERFGWGDATAVPGYNIVELANPGDEPKVVHIDIPTRAMHTLKPVYGEGKPGREVADAVLEQLRGIDDVSAMARIEFREIDRPTRREAHTLLKREASAFIWHLDVAPERATFVPESGGSVVDDSALNLHSLFAEFVASRKAIYPTEAFATQFLERGSRALTDAMIAEENPTPEDDNLS